MCLGPWSDKGPGSNYSPYKNTMLKVMREWQQQYCSESSNIKGKASACNNSRADVQRHPNFTMTYLKQES